MNHYYSNNTNLEHEFQNFTFTLKERNSNLQQTVVFFQKPRLITVHGC